MKTVLRTVVLAAVGAVLAVPSATHVRAECRSEDSCGPQWTGKYRYVGGEQEKRARMEAIEAGTAGMFFAARPIARRRLRSDTEPYRNYELRVTDETVTIETDVRWTTPIDGTPRKLEDAGGDRYSVSTAFVGGKLVQRITDDSLDNVNVFSLSADHERLRIRIRIDHDRLSGTVTYPLTYRRVP